MKFLENKVILITGGTGSFGNAVLSALIKSKIKEIKIFSRDEKKQEDMRLRYNNKKINFIIGDVRDYQSLLNVTKNVDLIFHAAALKQVPSCEFFPMEAVSTNIVGTENLINAAIFNKVQKVVVLSTDKAVYPINAMGISKAMAEKIAVAKARSLIRQKTTIICCTRYGNVMGSRGSVIPLFIDQIKNKKEITVTDPNMTRFLMSLDDSVNLVLHAFQKSSQGDIFIQKSPSARLKDLIQALKEIFNSNNKVKVIGTRHGEKLYETLISREEMARSKETKNYFKIMTDQRDLNYSHYFSEGQLDISNENDYTSHNTKILSIEEIKKTLLNLKFVQDSLND